MEENTGTQTELLDTIAKILFLALLRSGMLEETADAIEAA
ncbi:hypothetical protein Heshes_24350 [Alicyclobacillus hesperidum]|uniref:Uncharacterized protein n=1 Tax=Alicyclobacillus hesperidum TaxID=89784 RepID=A0A1H2X547_9BACL|nr:hypothetical protein Heshes_24350 [Alicyclobacillus hesperidum]SDW87907.1 hypothetical protein SAMN04489725_11844 [Alicyclobacillus hesperidum]